MDEQGILYVIALAARYGADRALTEAIESGLISPDQHINSDDYAAAVDAAEMD